MTAPIVTARLTLIAHAPTRAQRDATFPRVDEAAEEAGLAQAARMSAGRTPRKVDRLWTAPERRTRQTADRLAAPLGLEIAAEPAPCDLDVGAWQGRSLADLSATEADGVAAWLSDPEARPHGGESLAQLRARVAAWLETVPRDGHTLAITHPAVIRMAVAQVLEAPPPAFWRLDITPLSLTDLRWNRRWTVRTTGVDLRDLQP
ncbi:histidine phosphatase family protein [Nitrospirillum iridis]|uniref:Broad specificity phosphatase PhoE n=1 Tax=Nitrospirillum iridis TaxID=765888 RepID=A0A7X0B1T8_9PROT|nr:broad specificity phosphatase PhoE [Nitrospirillum iridis]